MLSKLREHIRLKKGQNSTPSLGVADSQSVQWGNTSSLMRIDGNKKIKGIKRHIFVDKNGFLLAVMVTVANVHDSKAILLLARVLKELLSSVKLILVDGGYRGKCVEIVKEKFQYILQVTMLSKYKKEKKKFKILPKRWVGRKNFFLV